jgi:hypothetical protein
MSEKEIKLPNGKTLVFGEGCFDAVESEEELEALMDEIIKTFSELSEEELEAMSEPFDGEIEPPKTRQ